MSEFTLTDKIKDRIQSCYRRWLEIRQFRPRRGQREMIAEVARTLSGAAPRLAALEAGTGTGKTAAYCLAAIPIGQALGKTVVISTATIALQEQVVLRDLPDLRDNAGLDFSFALAKGRGRYVCLKRLDDRLKYDGQELGLFEQMNEDGAELFNALLNAFAEKSWNGERDSWDAGIDEGLWRSVTTDHRGCSNNKCSYFRQCPFFKARTGLDGVDVIVANHDLLLADLSLGGGAVLPEPEEAIYIIDEAHHLPEKTQQHFSVSSRLRGTSLWTDTAAGVLGSLTQRFGRPTELIELATQAAEQGLAAREALVDLAEALLDLEYQVRDEALATHRFPLGQVPQTLSDLSRQAAAPLEALAGHLGKAHELLQLAMEGGTQWDRAFEAEDWLPPVGQLESRARATLELLEDYNNAASVEDGPVHARWCNQQDDDVELVSAPIIPGELLREALWDRCYGAICTSATLTSLGRFDRFLDRAGLRQAHALRIASPFDYPNIATFCVPDMRSDPRDFDAHSDEVTELLPGLLAHAESGLVLFTSWRQLHRVCDALPEAVRRQLKIQGDGSKQALLQAHRDAVDAGDPSFLVGLASFSEGVDLPDDYCRHVVLVKLPFSVPDDPVDQAMAEWAEAQGKNPFYEISVPDAALKLVQACGRLIRHEKDWGRITLLDRRIVTQRYGRALLESLPPFKRELSFP